MWSGSRIKIQQKDDGSDRIHNRDCITAYCMYGCLLPFHLVTDFQVRTWPVVTSSSLFLRQVMAGVGLPASILQLRLAASPSTTTSTSAGTVEITGFTEKYHCTVREFGMVVRHAVRLKAFKEISTRVK